MSTETNYLKEYDEKIVKLAKEGKFFQEIAEEFDVTSRTMRNWRDTFPSFSIAYEKARDIILNRMMRTMLDNATNRNYNPRVHEFLLEMMSRHSRFSTVKINGISKGNFSEKVDSVLNAVENGELQAVEAQAMMNTLKTGQEIKDAKEALDKLEKIEGNK